MNMPVRALSTTQDPRDESRTSLLRSLSDFTKQHRAANWEGSFAAFLEGVFPADSRGIARSSTKRAWRRPVRLHTVNDRAESVELSA